MGAHPENILIGCAVLGFHCLAGFVKSAMKIGGACVGVTVRGGVSPSPSYRSELAAIEKTPRCKDFIETCCAMSSKTRASSDFQDFASLTLAGGGDKFRDCQWVAVLCARARVRSRHGKGRVTRRRQKVSNYKRSRTTKSRVGPRSRPPRSLRSSSPRSATKSRRIHFECASPSESRAASSRQ